jgi:meso-butanediol dehydrogenase / (S,S)-butanediol dehydrogenase / diacetyl reductase
MWTDQDPVATTDRAVIVTGGGSGIGRQVARQFAQAGACVQIIGRTMETLKETAAGYPGIHPYQVDLAEPGTAASAVAAAAAAFGRLDVLINNAGITRPALLGAIDLEAARQQVEVNLLAPLALAQAALPYLKASSGVIVNVSSNPPMRGWPRNSVYGATKVALDFLTYTWAAELGPQGIRVVSVAPGSTKTAILSHAGLGEEEIEANFRQSVTRIPLRRRADPDEIAWWIVNVTRPEASYVTGTVIRVDGGQGAG